MSVNDGYRTDRQKECARCGWKQTTGGGSFVLNCPGCGGSRWVPVTLDSSARKPGDV